MKLFHKFSLSVVGLVAGVIIGIGLMSLYSERQLLDSEIDKHAADITLRLSQICEESLYRDDLVLFNYLKSLTSERAFVAAYFQDNQGLIRVHSNPSLIGKKITNTVSSDFMDLPISRNIIPSEDGWPLWLFQARVKYGTSDAGLACVVLDKTELDEFVKDSLIKNFKRWIPIGILSLILGLCGALLLTRTMLHPIQLVVNHMKEVGEGRREVFPPTKRKDELGWMAFELNKTIIKLKELDQLKNEFVSAVTHELRSPLTAIERFVSLMLKGTYGPLTGDQQDTLNTIKNNSIRLSQFIDDVLTTSKLESRRIEPYLETFDVRTVIEEVHKLYVPIANEKGLRFELPPSSVTPPILADRTMVHHILSNLVSNALKFTEKGSVTIGTKNLGSSLQIEVIDTGPGIPDKDKGRIFDKFYRSLDTAHKTKGTGLGLFIVKSFLDIQNGKFHLKDNPKGPGTVISIILPISKT